MKSLSWAVAVLTAAFGLTVAAAAQAIPPPAHLVPADFDGDGDSDLAMWNPADGQWRFATVCEISPGTGCGFSHGHLTGSAVMAIAVPRDYDGDGTSDPAFFDPQSGVWRIVPLTAPASDIRLGLPGDIPMPADYDGDGVTEPAVFRPADATWRFTNSVRQLGQPGQPGDLPAAGDYDGDGRADLAVYRPKEGLWIVQRSGDGQTTAEPAEAGGKPVTGDYDGDGRLDLAIYRPDHSQWWIRRSSDGRSELVTWGEPGDMPVPGDYDGDGITEMAVYRPPGGQAGPGGNGTWFIRGVDAPIVFGNPDEMPVS
jgi:hypothetical protein